MSSEIVVADKAVGALARQMTDVAGVCKDIVTKTASLIQGKKYVRVEGWQSIAVAYGCIASARDVEAIPGGVRAIGEVRRVSDGAVLSTAEGFVGDDEKTWSSRPMYARRAMAQTRAISRACRNCFAFVVTLIDGNLSTTPAEEMDFVDHVPAKQDNLKAQLAASVLQQAHTEAKVRRMPIVDAKTAEEQAEEDGYAASLNQQEPPPDMVLPTPGPKERKFAVVDVPTPKDLQAANRADVGNAMPLPNYGRSGGMRMCDVDGDTLGWYIKGCQRTLADSGKARFHEKERVLLAALEAELGRRR